MIKIFGWLTFASLDPLIWYCVIVLVAVEFRDIPVQFLGQDEIARNLQAEEKEVADFLRSKPLRRNLHGFEKDLLLSLTLGDGVVTIYPKSGGKSLKIELSSICAVATILP